MTRTVPNPELTVGHDNKQWWNQPKNRRYGFHNAHRLFRRAHMVRSRKVWVLENVPDKSLAASQAVADLTGTNGFSAIVVAHGNKILWEQSAADFAPDRLHSIQSVTKMHIHLIIGALLRENLIDLSKLVRHYLPEIGSGYADASIQNLLDMNVLNDFSEDYDDPNSDCYVEEIALGWRLPAGDTPETSLLEFACNITGDGRRNEGGQAVYKSANTDVLTLICDRLSPHGLFNRIEAIADAAGYEGSFNISLSPDGLPAFSGGGCLSARDLARFGLLLHRIASTSESALIGNTEFLRLSSSRDSPALAPPKDWLHYSNHLMTDGECVAHAGYGGQFLMTNLKTGIVCAYLSVLENESGYDDDYMEGIINAAKAICGRSGPDG